ncbi:MAG TPA: M48 family metallopeptidase [Candidatus Limnocylindrales bacterium]|nr:M48 family metallopeptidase [Candidatus Limnocylindrales bacterium]
MSKYRITLAVLVLTFFAFSLRAADDQTSSAPATPQPQTSVPSGAASPATAAPETTRKVTAYTLPPDLYKKARDRSRIRFRLALIGFVYGLAVLWIVLHWKIGAKFRDWAEGFSSVRFLQAVVFVPLLILTLAIFTLPLDIYGEIIEKQFGISVQGWGSWAWDWTKGEIISLILSIIFFWILYAVIRRSPRRWWFYFWVVSLPIGILLFFITPWVIDPLFHKFEPLQQKDPALTVALEKMVQRAGEDIPPERIFWMGAGEKTTALNAYVTGIGASKRMVLWDTTIAKMNTPQMVFVMGHETGHYALQHIPKGISFFAVLLLILFYIGYRLIGSILARWGPGWGIRGLDDWASLPVLMLLLSVFLFVTNPIAAAFGRHIEHQADQFGLEVTHGLTPDSGQVAAQAFQILGEVDLADPEPNPVAVFLFYDHPAIPDRVQFSLHYDPWASGGQGEFVK